MENIPQQINHLQQRLKLLEASTTIPLEVEAAFRERLGINAFSALEASSKAASSENVTVVTSVNFGAQTVGTGTVLDNPDTFLQVVIGGSTYYIPAFTS